MHPLSDLSKVPAKLLSKTQAKRQAKIVLPPTEQIDSSSKGGVNDLSKMKRERGPSKRKGVKTR